MSVLPSTLGPGNWIQVGRLAWQAFTWWATLLAHCSVFTMFSFSWICPVNSISMPKLFYHENELGVSSWIERRHCLVVCCYKENWTDFLQMQHWYMLFSNTGHRSQLHQLSLTILHSKALHNWDVRFSHLSFHDVWWNVSQFRFAGCFFMTILGLCILEDYFIDDALFSASNKEVLHNISFLQLSKTFDHMARVLLAKFVY